MIEILGQFRSILELLITRRDRQFARNAMVRIFLDTLGSVNQSLINFRALHDPVFHRPEAPVKLDWAESEYIARVRTELTGRHQLLAASGGSRYSILVPLDNGPGTDLSAVDKSIRSVLGQTAPDFEVLVNVGGGVGSRLQSLLTELSADRVASGRLRLVQAEENPAPTEAYRIINLLAEQATGQHFLLVNPGELIRPDLLYRYEQTLRLFSQPDDVILYCNDFMIDAEESILPGGDTIQPLQLHFPYEFSVPNYRGLMVPAARWRRAGGLSSETAATGLLELFLRLDLDGARFFNLPLMLVAARKGLTGGQLMGSGAVTESGIRLLSEYYRQKGLEWGCDAGYAAGGFRAIPPLLGVPKIHVIVPFHNQKELTLRAIRSILAQRGVTPLITTIDNRSSDDSIATELTTLGAEVLKVDEPFNFSRICNIGARQSQHTAQSDLLLFLNNDVELDGGALAEMARWIHQERIGIVGARLHFPNRTIQHAGVELVTSGSHLGGMLWRHIDYKMIFSRSRRARQAGVCDAITGACLMIRRGVFEAVDGFDETWYPVALSDTDLAVRVKKLGLHCFYTPFAFGTHYENATRKVGTWEDFEFSPWLYQNARMRESTADDLIHPLLGRL